MVVRNRAERWCKEMTAATRSREAQRSRTRMGLRLIGVVLLGALLSPGRVVAQNGPVEKQLEEEIKSKAILFGTENKETNLETAGTVISMGGENEKEQADFGANSINAEKIVIQPLKGERALLDSDATKEMYKEALTKKVPVYFQTLFMVENGAATGYLGALNTVSNLMSNTMQTQQFQWELIKYADEASDNKARLREAYTSKLVKNLQEEKTWPAAIYKTVGDGGKDQNNGGKNNDIPKNEEPDEIFKFTDLCDQGANQCKLSELVFIDQGKEKSPLGNKANNAGGQQQQYANKDLADLKKEFVLRLGDTVYKENGQEKVAQELEQDFVPPEQKAVGNGGAQRRGYDRKLHENLAQVWENLGKVLAGACTHLQGDKNAAKSVDQMIFLSQTDEIKFDDLRQAQSIDTPLTAYIVEELVRVTTTDEKGKISKKDCDMIEQGVTPANLEKLLEGGQNASSQDNIQDCSDGKLCRPMRIYLSVAKTIARSKTYHLYSKLYFEAMKFATKPDMRVAVDELFAKTFPQKSLQDLIEINRGDWQKFLVFVDERRAARAAGSSNTSGNSTSGVSLASANDAG